MNRKKRCDYCGKYYPEDSFGIALTCGDKVYRRRKCSGCYRATKQNLIKKYFDWLNNYKRERGCFRCKIRDVRVLDFHHKNGRDKLFNIGGFRRSVGFKRILEEVAKCEVICANCHRITHEEARRP